MWVSISAFRTVWWRWRRGLPHQRQAWGRSSGRGLTWGTRSRTFMTETPPSDQVLMHPHSIRRGVFFRSPGPTNYEPVTAVIPKTHLGGSDQDEARCERSYMSRGL